MDSDNLAFLNDSLKYLGFGEKSFLNQHLEQCMARGDVDFQLFTEAFFDDDTKLEARLYFKKGDNNKRNKNNTEYYFFSRYDSLLRFIDHPERDRAHTFYINKGSGVTFKEAFNLLNGRAVYKW